jgi:UDP-glucose 4-epimerase
VSLNKFLVTGATGFIGSHLCDRLLKRGAEVEAITRVVPATTSAACHWRAVDLADFAATARVFRDARPDTVFHLASHVTGTRSLDAVIPTFLSNAASTVNVLVAATEVGCRRVVLAGSSEEPLSSEVDATPCSPYAAAKWTSATYGRLFHRIYGAPVVHTRIFMTYGPAQRDELKLIPYVIRCLLEEKPPLLASGRRQVDWIYVDDVVDGLLAAAEAPDAAGGTFDLGTGMGVSIREVVEELVRLTAPHVQPVFGARPDPAGESERVADTRVTSMKLNWKAKTTLNVGLKRTVDWHRARAAGQ